MRQDFFAGKEGENMLDLKEEAVNIKTGIYAARVRQMMQKREGEYSDERVARLCEEVILNAPELAGLSVGEKVRIVRLVFCSLRCELEILQDLADDRSVSEIMVNGPDAIFAERNGRIERQNLAFDDEAQLERVIQRLAAKVGREMNELNPIVDARLSDGSRINAVNSNIAIGGPILTIRRFGSGRLTMEDLIANGDITDEAAEFIKALVKGRYNIFVSGGTSSGKTTFLNVLSDHIPTNERIIVIEDSAELSIRNHENLVRLEAKNANAQGKGAVTIRDLVKSSLRMRPDRIIVGEVRGAETVEMLAAMSTGHDGSLSTGHANSPRGMVGRLESLLLASTNFPIEAIRNQIAGAIEIFVHMARDVSGHRRVVEITELTGMKNGEILLNTIFRYDPDNGLVKAGELQNREKLRLYE